MTVPNVPNANNTNNLTKNGGNVIGSNKQPSPAEKSISNNNPANLSAAERINRPERIPLYKQKRQLFGVKPRAGYHRCIILEPELNDDTMEQMLAAGYSMVKENGEVKKFMLNKSKGQRGILMEIPIDLYQEELNELARIAKERVKISSTPNPAFRQFSSIEQSK